MRHLILAMGLLLSVASALAAQDDSLAPVIPADAGRKVLALEEAVRLALTRNLALQAQSFETRAGDAELSRAYGLYDPRLGLYFNEGESNERSNQVFFEASNAVRFREFGVSLDQKLPTGAALSLDFDNRRQDSSPAPGINPAYRGEVRFSLVQPLLKGLGSTVTEQGILLAAKDRDVAVENLREQAFAVLSEVRNGYFEALRLRRNVLARQTSVALAETLLAENRERVRVGMLPQLDVLEAEFGLKQRERDLLDAERAYLDALDLLALLLDSPEPVTVAAVPMENAVQTDLQADTQQALAKRPDVQRRHREIERLDIQRRVARNARLPALDLGASYGHKGLGREYSNNLSDLGGGDFPNWQVGLTLSYPLGNREARHEARRLAFLQQSRQALLAQLHSQVRTEIMAAIRLLEVSGKKLEVAASGLAFAEEKLRNVMKRKEVGLATTRQVLEAEEDLAQARTDESASRADYHNAVTVYWQVSGQLLEIQGVRFSGEFRDESRPLLAPHQP